MSTNKVWNLLYVVGNPAMFKRVTACADNPQRRADALAGAERLAANGWRVWVEHARSLERIFESPQELDHCAHSKAVPLEAKNSHVDKVTP